MKEIIEQLLSAANLTQLLVIVLAAVTGVVAAHFIRAALARSALTGTQGLLARVLRGLGATSTALVALVVLLVARGLLSLGGDRPDIIDTGRCPSAGSTRLRSPAEYGSSVDVGSIPRAHRSPRRN